MATKGLLLDLKAKQCGDIKTIFDVVGAVLEEANIIFDENYIRIYEMEPTQVAIVHLELDKACFEKYYCAPGNPQRVGIELSVFNRLLKSLNNPKADLFRLYVDAAEPDRLCMRINFRNSRNQLHRYQMLDILELQKPMPDLAYACEFRLPATELQNTCKQMKEIGEFVEIKCLHDRVVFTCNGDDTISDFEWVETPHQQGEEVDGLCFGDVRPDPNKPIIGQFPLKFIIAFVKATPLSGQVSIFIENEFPMIMQYRIGNAGNMGILRFALCPRDPSTY